MKNEPLLYLSAAAVYQALPMLDAIAAMRQAFAQLSSGQVTLPVRGCLSASGKLGVDLIMPCHCAGLGMFSLKTVTVYPDNPKQGKPTNQALIVLTDDTDGTHLAVMDGASLTALRTGAASGVATDLLADSNATRVAIFGAGVQARTQLEAVCCVRAIQQASVYDLDRSAARQFAVEMTERLGIPVQAADSPAANLRSANIVCTATPACQPVFVDTDLPPRVHINAVGAFRPEMVEIPASIISQAYVVVDHYESVFEEAGDLIQPLNQGLIQKSHARQELGELLSGKPVAQPPTDQITVFKSVGVAVQDLYAAARALSNARRLGLGQSLA